MITRKVKNEDFETLDRFWCRKGLPHVPPDFYPPTGLVVTRIDGSLLCGGFLVKSDTNAASLAFISADPEADPQDRSEALDILIQELEFEAKRSGFSLLTMATNVPALQARYARLGFSLTDENVKVYGGFV